eukprot:1380643-Pyramimonas_sp.AAC.1
MKRTGWGLSHNATEARKERAVLRHKTQRQVHPPTRWPPWAPEPGRRPRNRCKGGGRTDTYTATETVRLEQRLRHPRCCPPEFDAPPRR